MKKFESPINVTKTFLPPFEEYVNEIKNLWDSHWITNNGTYHNKLQDELKKFLKVTEVTLFTNGHLALDIAIKSLKLSGEVITTPFTFASTTHAIVMNGLTPVFCDINREDFTMDVDKIENLITDKTSAIIPVHVFGFPCDVYRIQQIADKYKLKVIYDAAHAFGIEIDGQSIGNFGDISMFSLHATKVYNSIEGGILTYNNFEFKELFNLYKNFGISGQETVKSVGLNAKMNEFQAIMGLLNLNYVNDEIIKRKRIVEIYREGLKNLEGIYFLNDKTNVKNNYSYFPIIVDENKSKIDRNTLFEKLKEYNIFTRKYFFPLTTDYLCYKDKYNCEITNAKYISERVLTLPLYGELTSQCAEIIVSIIKMLVKK